MSADSCCTIACLTVLYKRLLTVFGHLNPQSDRRVSQWDAISKVFFKQSLRGD